jgi:hypothetical protein
MQIGAQGIKNIVVTSIIHGYGVENQKTPTQKKNLSIPFHSNQNSQIKIYFHKRRKKNLNYP